MGEYNTLLSDSNPIFYSMSSKQNIVSESLITPALAAKMRVFFEEIEPSAEVKYKHLYSQLQQENEKKASRLVILNSQLDSVFRAQSMCSSRHKFSRINQSASRCIERSTRNSVFNSFEESYMGEKLVADSLQKQYLQYENSLLRLRHNIKDINLKMSQIKVKQPLYDKLSTISRFQKISSMYIVGKAEKELKKVLCQKQQLTYLQADFNKKKQQTRMQDISMRNNIEDRIGKLKLRRIATRQELSRLNNELIIPQEQFTITSIIEYYQKLLQLFREKQPEFQNIKLETCVKIGKPLKTYPGMYEQKVQEVLQINNFEQEHKIKLSSMCNILKTIYNRLKHREDQLNFQYEELMLIKDDRVNDLELIQKKQNYIGYNELEGVKGAAHAKRFSKQFNQIEGKKEFMRQRSKFWVEFVQFWRTLLVKMANAHKLIKFYQEDKGIQDQIEGYFAKYDYHQNTNYQSSGNALYSIIFEHFEGQVSKQVLVDALETFLCDWKSSFYLKREVIYEQISHLPSALTPEQKLYTLLDHLLVESHEAFRAYLSHSIKMFISCYNVLAVRKSMFSMVKKIRPKKQQGNNQVKDEINSIPSDNNVKEEMLITRNFELVEKQEPRQDTEKMLIKLLKMAAVPMGEMLSSKGSKRGCFY